MEFTVIQCHVVKPPLRRYEMQDILAIESSWLTELAPHMYKLVPVNTQMRS